jgi:hypothetical protein
MIWRGNPAVWAALCAALFCFTASARAADDAESLVKQGDGFLKDRNLPGAIEVYRKAVQLKPDLQSARQGLLTALADAGKFCAAQARSGIGAPGAAHRTRRRRQIG